MYLKTALARKSHRKRKRRIYTKIYVKDEGVYPSCIKEEKFPINTKGMTLKGETKQEMLKVRASYFKINKPFITGGY